MKGDWLLSVTPFKTGQIATGHVMCCGGALIKNWIKVHQSPAVVLTGINNNDQDEYETGPRGIFSGIRDWRVPAEG